MTDEPTVKQLETIYWQAEPSPGGIQAVYRAGFKAGRSVGLADGWDEGWDDGLDGGRYGFWHDNPYSQTLPGSGDINETGEGA